MFRLLWHDIKRVLYSPYFWVAVLMFFAFGLLQQSLSITGHGAFLLPKKNIKHIGTFNRYILSLSSPGKGTMESAMPVITVLPCAALFLSEYKSRYMRNVLVRTGKRRYIISKILCAFLMGAAAVLMGEIVLMIVCTAIDPHASNAILRAMGKGSIYSIYSSSVVKYALLESANLMLFGGVYSCFALGFSALLNNKYLTLTTGFLLSNVVIAELKKVVNIPYDTTCENLFFLDFYHFTYADVLIQYGCILLAGICVFAFAVLRRCRSDV